MRRLPVHFGEEVVDACRVVPRDTAHALHLAQDLTVRREEELGSTIRRFPDEVGLARWGVVHGVGSSQRTRAGEEGGEGMSTLIPPQEKKNPPPPGETPSKGTQDKSDAHDRMHLFEDHLEGQQEGEVQDAAATPSAPQWEGAEGRLHPLAERGGGGEEGQVPLQAGARSPFQATSRQGAGQVACEAGERGDGEAQVHRREEAQHRPSRPERPVR